MEARVEKETLLGEMRQKGVTTTIKEITPFGVRLEWNWQGEVEGGKFSARVSGTSEIFLKNDGTYDWESKHIDTTNEGDLVVSNASGTGKMTGPTAHEGKGEFIYLTQSPKLSWLNMKRGRAEFTGDLGTDEMLTKLFVF